MNTIIQFLIHIHWYVVLLFFYLVFIAITMLKADITSPKRLGTIPIALLGITIDTMNNDLGVSALQFSILVIGLVLGSVLGWLQFSHLSIQVDQHKKLLQVPKSYFVLIVVILMFAVKYTTGYFFAVDHSLSIQTARWLLFLSSIFSGLFVGRFVYAHYKIKTGPHTDLN